MFFCDLYVKTELLENIQLKKLVRVYILTKNMKMFIPWFLSRESCFESKQPPWLFKHAYTFSLLFIQ